jgi:hypothetical protein
MVHNAFNAIADITSQHHHHAHHAQAIAIHAQVLQTAQLAEQDTMLPLMEHVYPTQQLKTRMLKSLLQDSLSSPSSSSSSSKDYR